MITTAMLSSFLSFLNQQQLIKSKQTPTLIGVSGGVDSMVLCHLFKQAGLPFAIAHCNFNLRGKDALLDETFVKHMALQYQVPCYVQNFYTKHFAKKHKISTQMAARTLRYAFFNELLAKHGLEIIATAHHWDDVIETILLNFIKGTSIQGFQGIKPLHNNIIRPLLFARKQAIIAYAKKEQLSWQEDQSNNTIDYQRNFIRHKIIPLLYHINPNFEETTRTTHEKLTDVSLVFQTALTQIKAKYFSSKPPIHRLSIEPIIHLPTAKTILYEIVRPYGFMFNQITQLVLSYPCSGKFTYSKSHALLANRQHWIIMPKAYLGHTQFQPTLIHKDQIGQYHQYFYTKIYDRNQYSINPNPNIAALDYATLTFPLTIRSWHQGDRFCPLGMKQHKKISDFLIDLKIDIATKKQILVITSNNQIVWIIGYRIDNRFKITPKTSQVLEITLHTP